MTATISCAHLLYSSNTSGIIRARYRNNMNCEWNLTSSDKLELVFLHVETHSSADYVNVYDGDSAASRLIATISRSSRLAPILSSSNELHVRFTSDGSGQCTAMYRGSMHLILVEIFIKTCLCLPSVIFFFLEQRRKANVHKEYLSIYTYCYV